MPPPEFLRKVKETKTGDNRIFEYIAESRPRAKL